MFVSPWLSCRSAVDCVIVGIVKPQQAAERFVTGHVPTMWFAVCGLPNSQSSDVARPHLCKLARHELDPCRDGSARPVERGWGKVFVFSTTFGSAIA